MTYYNRTWFCRKIREAHRVLADCTQCYDAQVSAWELTSLHIRYRCYKIRQFLQPSPLYFFSFFYVFLPFWWIQMIISKIAFQSEADHHQTRDRLFCSCDINLDFDKRTWPIYSLKTYLRIENEFSKSRLSKVRALQTDTQGQMRRNYNNITALHSRLITQFIDAERRDDEVSRIYPPRCREG